MASIYAGLICSLNECVSSIRIKLSQPTLHNIPRVVDKRPTFREWLRSRQRGLDALIGSFVNPQTRGKKTALPYSVIKVFLFCMTRSPRWNSLVSSHGTFSQFIFLEATKGIYMSHRVVRHIEIIRANTWWNLKNERTKRLNVFFFIFN